MYLEHNRSWTILQDLERDRRTKIELPDSEEVNCDVRAELSVYLSYFFVTLHGRAQSTVNEGPREVHPAVTSQLAPRIHR